MIPPVNKPFISDQTALSQERDQSHLKQKRIPKRYSKQAIQSQSDKSHLAATTRKTTHVVKEKKLETTVSSSKTTKFHKEIKILKKQPVFSGLGEEEHRKIIHEVIEKLGNFYTDKLDLREPEDLQELINSSVLRNQITIEEHYTEGETFIVHYLDLRGTPQIIRVENVKENDDPILPIQEAQLMILKQTMEEIHEILTKEELTYIGKAKNLSAQISEVFLRKLEPVATSSGAFSPVPSALSHTSVAGVAAVTPMSVDFAGGIQMVMGGIEIMRASRLYEHAKHYREKASQVEDPLQQKIYLDLYRQQRDQSSLQFLVGMSGFLSGETLVGAGACAALGLTATTCAIGAAGLGIIGGTLTGAISLNECYKSGSSLYQLRQLKKEADQYFNPEEVDYDPDLHELVKDFIKQQNRICKNKLASNGLALGASIGAVTGSSLGLALVLAGPTAGLSLPIGIGVAAGATVLIVGTKIVYDKLEERGDEKEQKENIKTNPLRTAEGMLMELAFRMRLDMQKEEKYSFIGNEILSKYMHLEPLRFVTLVDTQFQELKTTNEILYYRIIKALEKKYEIKYKDLIQQSSGRITLPNGIILEGQFKNGELNGSGRKILTNGTILKGQFKESKLHGPGKIHFSNGIIWKGEFKNDKLNGQGKKVLSDGSVQEGEFKDNWLSGQGKKTFADGTIQKGKFKNDFLNGEGQVTYPDGKIEEGIFKNGLFVQH